jgi:hypothetical protein
MLVLQRLELEDAASVEDVLVRRRNQVNAVRVFLREPGYEPGPVEIMDGLLRLELGDSYFEARSGWDSMSAAERRTALRRRKALQDAVDGAVT